jgi:hypothetical protein
MLEIGAELKGYAQKAELSINADINAAAVHARRRRFAAVAARRYTSGLS